MDNSNHDIEYLQRCRETIEQKLTWRPAAEWRNYEFKELSEKIFDTTGVNLSPTTLKRVFGKLKYESLPSTVTLNALANYIGFSSWMDFKSKPGNSIEILPPVEKRKPLINKKAWLAGSAAVLVCIVITLLLVSGRSSHAIKNKDAIIFKSQPIAEGLPNSVVFNVDLKGNEADNIIIQQYWDSTKTVRLQPGQTEATGIYYIPGYFRAKLILDGQVVKEHDLFIKSENWIATIDHKPIPTYVKRDELILDNKMEINGSTLNEIKKISVPTYLTYHLVRPFDGLQSDNFTLETSIKNTYGEGPAVCRTAKIFIICSKGAFIVPFTIPGCISDINLMANDYYLDGKSHDLSSFGADLAEWSPVKIEVRGLKMKVFLNDKLIREEIYKEEAGEVVGLRFSFLGAGAVKYVKLKNEKEEIKYLEEFK
jgi:hypothetical protein